jgi:hypothetical protein
VDDRICARRLRSHRTPRRQLTGAPHPGTMLDAPPRRPLGVAPDGLHPVGAARSHPVGHRLAQAATCSPDARVSPWCERAALLEMPRGPEDVDERSDRDGSDEHCHQEHAARPAWRCRGARCAVAPRSR